MNLMCTIVASCTLLPPPLPVSFHCVIPTGIFICLQHSVVHQPLLSYKLVVDNVASVIPHMWEEFGRALAITPPRLQEIRGNNPDNDRSTFCDIVQEWKSSRTTHPFTWEILGMILKSIGDGQGGGTAN